MHVTVTGCRLLLRGHACPHAVGRKRVEKFQIGDEVMTASGVARPIKWIGRRSDIWPLRHGTEIHSAGLHQGRRARRQRAEARLWVSPNHAMYFHDKQGGVLIEAKDLVNGVSIMQAERVEQIEYFHIELETHDVIIAEGALSESSSTIIAAACSTTPMNTARCFRGP